MSFLEYIVLGFIQGLTEFLPVSSSGHLWIFETLIFDQPSSIALEAFLHFATLLAVLFFFFPQLWDLIKSVFGVGKNVQKQRMYVAKLLAATLVTIPVALLLKPFVEFEITTQVVTITLFLTGIFILISEYCSPKKIKDFSWLAVILVGFFQGIAVIPGISRSGITIVVLLLLGIERKKAVETSFLLSIPTILGAFVFLLPEISGGIESSQSLLAGGIIAFLAALLAIWGMLRWIERYWKYFSLWCFGVAAVLFVVAKVGM